MVLSSKRKNRSGTKMGKKKKSGNRKKKTSPTVNKLPLNEEEFENSQNINNQENEEDLPLDTEKIMLDAEHQEDLIQSQEFQSLKCINRPLFGEMICRGHDDYEEFEHHGFNEEDLVSIRNGIAVTNILDRFTLEEILEKREACEGNHFWTTNEEEVLEYFHDTFDGDFTKLHHYFPWRTQGALRLRYNIIHEKNVQNSQPSAASAGITRAIFGRSLSLGESVTRLSNNFIKTISPLTKTFSPSSNPEESLLANQNDDDEDKSFFSQLHEENEKSDSESDELRSNVDEQYNDLEEYSKNENNNNLETSDETDILSWVILMANNHPSLLFILTLSLFTMTYFFLSCYYPLIKWCIYYIYTEAMVMISTIFNDDSLHQPSALS